MLQPTNAPGSSGASRYDKIRYMRPILLLLIMALTVAGCSLPAIPAQATHVSSGTVLFKDDFASPLSGWDHVKFEEGVMDYDGGGYRMLVNAHDLNFWATPHKDFSDVRVEVDTLKLGGPDENRIGLICRSDGKSYYFFVISSDGYYGLGLFKGGVTTLLGQAQMQESSSIRTGVAVNHVRLDCKGGDLTAFANGFQLAAAHDTTLVHGDVGILTGTFKGSGADILFDNFVVLAP